ncbi:hypothetical protein CCMSSC00406_0002511 [Pleurotus cornucopiae]|uniref:Uncharacterized protein n=1 Tax=Pleurotus cornucopiae TaxID=5321 RepID=A0ACB7IRT0_PLECO|nr:hypothetical protein CCMSSC00406_0002511 [Pleurotus cornucopiae]
MAELFFGVWTPKTDALGLTENNASIALDRAIFIHASSQRCMAGLDPNTFFLHVPIYVRRSYERLARSSALSLLITSEDLVQGSGTFRSASLLTRVCTPRVDYWGTNAEDDNETLGIHGFKWQAVSELDSWSGKQESAKDYPSGVRRHEGDSVLSLDNIALARRKASRSLHTPDQVVVLTLLRLDGESLELSKGYAGDNPSFALKLMENEADGSQPG